MAFARMSGFIITLTLTLLVKAQTTMTTFEGVVWGFDFLSDQQVLVTLRSGHLYLYDMKAKRKKQLPAPAVFASRQGGLLDVLIDRSVNPMQVYLTYSKDHPDGATTALAKASWVSNGKLVWKDIFVAKAHSSRSLHFGSRLLVVGPYIYMTVGDRGVRNRSQDLTVHHGKVLRLTKDGKAAPGNPFVKQSSARAEIFSLGHRNPQGISYHKPSGKILVAEFGPLGGDEVNIIEAGKNYGWPTITYGREYSGGRIGPSSKAGLEQPLVHWTPSLSPSGLAVFPAAKLKFVVAGLGSRKLQLVDVKNRKVSAQKSILESRGIRFRQVRFNTAGELFASSDAGQFLKIEKALLK